MDHTTRHTAPASVSQPQHSPNGIVEHHGCTVSEALQKGNAGLLSHQGIGGWRHKPKMLDTYDSHSSAVHLVATHNPRRIQCEQPKGSCVVLVDSGRIVTHRMAQVEAGKRRPTDTPMARQHGVSYIIPPVKPDKTE